MRRKQVPKICTAFVSLALLAVLWAPRASAQSSASLTGVVTDASGAPVAGATVTGKNLETAPSEWA